MGSAVSSAVGVPTLPTEEIQRLAQEVTTTFAPLYTKHYALAMVDKMQRDRSAPPKHYLLKEQPPASEPLKSGYLTKLGDVMKNWKRRFFVVTNEADNFEVRCWWKQQPYAWGVAMSMLSPLHSHRARAQVRYYVTEEAFKSAPDKPKGTINLCWYKVRPSDISIDGAMRRALAVSRCTPPPQVKRCTTADEIAANGELSIKLSPWWASDRRRTWAVRADDEASVKEWVDAFETAASKAAAPLNKDPVMRTAFEHAYRETRWALGEWGWFYYAAPEDRQLGMLVTDKCERGCMRDVYGRITPSAEAVVRPRVQAALDTTIGEHLASPVTQSCSAMPSPVRP